tara:strand:- start:1418 stop:2197 length:780 start_codon:yes stop_codon:yes gene_type:complete
MDKRKKKTLPKISIITVVLNGQKSIERCLKSVINQNYPKNKIEYIVIDGGSTDKTVSIIKKYKKKINYWHSKKDKGLYDAMNIGISKSTGNIIGILNSDDYFYPNAFKTISEYFNKFNIDFLFGSVLKKRIYHNFIPSKIWYTFNFYPSHSVSFFISKKAQKKIGKYNIKIKYSADRDLFYRMIKKFDLFGLPTKKNEVLGKFNIHGFSSKIPFLDKMLEEIKIRLSNKENIIQVFLVLIIFLNYYFMKFLINKIKSNK